MDDLGFDPESAVSESLGATAPEPTARPKLQASMALAVGTKPDYQAELRRVAKATGVPVDTVAAYPDEMKGKAALGQFDPIAYETMFPASASILSDVDLAKIAHDDTENMGAVEKVTTSFTRGLTSTLRGNDAGAITESTEILGIIDRIESGELDDDVKLAQATPYASLFAGVQREPERLKAKRALYEQRIAENALEFARRTKEVRNLPVSPEYQKFQESEGLGDAVGAFTDAPVSITSQILSESTGAMLPSIPFIVGGGAAGGVKGLMGAAGLTSAGTEYATDLANIFDGLGVDMGDEKAVRAAMATPEFKEQNRQALIKAGVVGTFDAATAGLAGTKLAKGAVKNVAAQAGVQAAGGATGEVAGSLASGQDVSASAALAEAIGEVPGSFVDVGTIALRNRKENQKAQAAEHNAQVIEKANELATASKVLQRDPDAFRQLVEKAAESGEVKDIYINPQDLAQSGVDIIGLAGISPSVQEQLQQALDTGGDIKIPLGEYMTNIAPTEFAQSFADHGKTEPDGMSRVQGQEFTKNQAAELQAEVDKVLVEKEGDDAFKASSKAVHDDVLRQLNEANRFSPDVNQSYATLHSNFAAVYGAKLGITPEEFYKKYYPQVNNFVQAQSAPGATLDLEQITREQALATNVKLELPTDENFTHAVKNTQGAEITPEGLKLDLVRFQKPEQEGAQAIRTGVFYLPKGAAQAKFYKTGKVGYGGTEKFEGETLLRRPLVVKGATGGKAPQVAYDQIKGKGAYEKMRTSVLNALINGRPTVDYVKTILETYGADAGLASEILRNSREGNTLPYAVQENIVAHAVRGAGYDSVVGYSKGKAGPFISEVFDVREQTYPANGIDSEVHGAFDASGNQLNQGQNNATDRNLDFTGTGQQSEDLYTTVTGEPAEQGWADATRIRGADGQPSSLYRGAGRPLSEADFDPDALGVNTGNPSSGLGVWFTISQQEAQRWGDVESYHLDIRNPYVVKVEDLPGFESTEAANTWREDLREQGYDGIIVSAKHVGGKVHLVAFDPEQVIYPQAKVPEVSYNQDPSNKRGSFNPSTSTITLLAKADLSTFLHESGHFFLETLNRIAQDPNAPAEIKQDMDKTLKWFGIQGESPEARLAEWNSHDLEWQRDYHEQFARGFEAYLFEGRAPSLEMQGVFSRFSSWLLRTYKHLLEAAKGDIGKALDVQMSDDVRGVFDRMLASREQIKEAEALRNFAPMFKTPEEAGMTPEQYKEYYDTGVQASSDAAHSLEKRSLRDMRWASNAKDKFMKKFQAQADTQRKAVRDEITDQVREEPLYKAMRWLKRGETVDADGNEIKATEGFRLNLDAVKEMYPETMNGRPDTSKLGFGQYGMLSKDGLHPDVVAEMFGFDSGDTLVRALVDAQPEAEVINGLTDKTMLERYGDLVDEGAVERAAEQAIHNEARVRFVATEMAALMQQMGSVQELTRLAKAAAESAIGQVKVKEINPNRYVAAGLRASKAADKALKKGDRAEAVRQKRLQLFNVAMTREAIDAKANSEKSLLKFRKLFRKDKVLAKKYDMKLITAARAVLGAYGIGGQVDKTQAMADLKKIKEYDPELYEQIEPVMEAALIGAADYRTIPYGEFKAMLDAVNQIVHNAKRTKYSRIDGELVNRKQITNELRERMEEIGVPENAPGLASSVTDADRRGWEMQGMASALRRIESWVDLMDGTKFGGPFRKYIFQPVSNGITKYRTVKNRVLRSFVEDLRAKQAEFHQGKIAAPEIGYTFDGKNHLLGALQHIGNPSNKRKLLLGMKWAEETATSTGEKVMNTSRMDAFLARMIKEGTLTKSDFDFLQKSVWDLMESIKPDAQKAFYDVHGRYFDEITAEPFTTPWGVYKGGYAPAVADKEVSRDADQKGIVNAIEEGSGYMFPSTPTGFTKGRVEYNEPLVMDLRLTASHIDQALRFTYVQPAVRDVVRILRSSSFANPMHKIDPTAITEMLMPWLQRSATQIASARGIGHGGRAMDRFWRAARKRTGMVAMTANFVNAAQQLTGFALAAVKVKPRYLKSSLLRYMKAPGVTTAAVAELSPWMAERLSSDSFELTAAINQILEDDTAWQKVKDISAKHAYFAQRAAQNVVDTVTWQAAFDQASGTMAEKEAVEFADSVVRQTQGSMSPEDISRFESGDTFRQVFTQFMGYFNMQANLLGTEGKKALRDMGGDKGRLAYLYAMGFLIPNLVADAIVRTFGWDWDDEDDDGYLDELFSWFFGSQVRGALGMVPVVGAVANAGLNAFNKQPFDDRLSTSPSVSTIESSLRAPVSTYKAIADGGKASKAIGDVLTLLTMATGVPFTAVSRPLKYAADAAQGRVEPENAVDAARGVISGKGREEERKR